MTDISAVQTTNANTATTPESTATAVVNGDVSVSRSEKVDTEYLERFEKLARRERELQSRNQKFKETESKAEKLERLTKLASEDPEAALAELGLNYSKLTEHMLNKSPEDEQRKRVETLEQRLARLENEKAEHEKAEKQKETDRVMQSAKDEIKRVIGESDEYELIRTMDRYDDVLETCIEYFNRTRKYLSFEDAATEVEKVLDEEYAPLLNAKKIKSKLSSQTPTDDGRSTNATDGDVTLSNSGMESANDGGFIDEKELMRRALAALKGS